MNSNIPLLDESHSPNLFNTCFLQDVNKNVEKPEKNNQTDSKNNNTLSKNLVKEYQANDSMVFMY